MLAQLESVAKPSVVVTLRCFADAEFNISLTGSKGRLGSSLNDTITLTDPKTTLVQDANDCVTQDLKVMKVKEAAGSKCFVLTLNRSDNALPEAVLNATAPVNFTSLVSVLIHDAAVLRISELVCLLA